MEENNLSQPGGLPPQKGRAPTPPPVPGRFTAQAPTSGPAPRSPKVPGLSANSSPTASVVPAPEKKTITIRTMRDDIEEAKGTPAGNRAATPAAAKKVSSSPAGADMSASPQEEGSVPVRKAPARAATVPLEPSVTETQGRAAFPLPPKANGAPKKTLQTPTQPRRRWLRVLSSLFVAVVLLSGAGAGAWYWWQQTTFMNVMVPSAAAAEVLPAEATVIVQYVLPDAAARSAVLMGWANPASDPTADTIPTVTQLLSGDPRFILNDSELSEFYYVLLPQNPRPYLVVPSTPAMRILVAENADLVSAEHGGWYILHAVSVETYRTALTAGSLATVGPPPLLGSTAGSPVRLLLGQEAVASVREAIGGSALTVGTLLEVAVSLQPSAAGTELMGTAVLQPTSTTGFTPALADQSLLSAIPASVATARLGANFADDLAHWRGVAGVLDDDILSHPQVSPLLQQLTGSYAYMSWDLPAGGRSVGLIITLPEAVRSTLTLQDPALERAMPALLPLILSDTRVPSLAFAEAVYAGVPLRYANIAGTSRALDYALTDSHLLIATSKDAMLALIDASQGSTVPSLVSGPPWSELFTAWGAVPPAHDIVLTTGGLDVLRPLLPGLHQNPYALGVAFSTSPASAASTAELNGILVYQRTSNGTVPLPFSSPLPTASTSIPAR